MFNKITGLEEKIYSFISDNYEDAIETAKKEFLKDDETLTGFDDWLIYGFKLDDDISALELYDNPAEISILKQSRYSFYEIVKEASGLYFKDIFTGDAFKMADDTKVGETIVSCRIYGEGAVYHYLENGIEFDIQSKNFLVKGLLEKYNTSVSGTQISLEDFIKGNLMLLIKFSSILFEIEVDDGDDHMTVHVSTFAVKDRNGLIESFKTKDALQLVEDDLEMIYTFTEGSSVIAEIVLMDTRLEVEANTRQDALKLKDFFEAFEMVEFIKLEALSIDDLLEFDN